MSVKIQIVSLNGSYYDELITIEKSDYNRDVLNYAAY